MIKSFADEEKTLKGVNHVLIWLVMVSINWNMFHRVLLEWILPLFVTLVNLDPSSLLKILIGKNAICQRIKVIVLIKGNQIAIVLKRGSYIMLSAEKLKIKKLWKFDLETYFNRAKSIYIHSFIIAKEPDKEKKKN